MPLAWLARVPRTIGVSVLVVFVGVAPGFAQQEQPGAPGGAPGVPPGTEQENPPPTRPGPPYVLEQGYTLTNVANNIQGIVVGVAADPNGNVYYATNSSPTVDMAAFNRQRTMEDAYGGLATFGYSQVVQIAPNGQQTVLLDESRDPLKCSTNGLTYNKNKLYIPSMGQIHEFDL